MNQLILLKNKYKWNKSWTLREIKAYTQVENKKEKKILIINLDNEKFYPSININFNTIKNILKINPQNYKDLWSKNETSKIFADKNSTIKIIIKLQWLNAMIYLKLRKYAIRYSILWDFDKILNVYLRQI